jgi:predicted ABC-type ATPase
MIAAGLSPFSPELAAIRAGRLMLEEIELSVDRGTNFGFETTLSGRAYLGVIRSLKERAYQVNFFYLWVPNVELVLARIRERVLRGGHDVPETVARRRFTRSIKNFLVDYRLLADSWNLYDNTTAVPKIIASEEMGQLRVAEIKQYNDLIERYGRV